MELSSSPNEGPQHPIEEKAYTIEQWHEEISPFFGDGLRYQPLTVVDEFKDLFYLLKDTETGVIYRYTFVKQSVSPEMGEPPEETWVNCVPHLRYGGSVDDVAA